MAPKSSRLTIRLGAEARAWLQAQAQACGLDEAALARMLIYQAMHAPAVPVAPAARPARTVAAPVSLEEMADEPHAEEIDVAPDPDDGADAGARGDALMGAAPSFLDALMTRAPSRAAAPARTLGPLDHRRAYAVAPGAYTRPVSVHHGGGNVQGDGVGNVRRDNMGHFGVVGTRSR